MFSFLRENTEWLGLRAQSTSDSRPVKLLDYACGSGIASTVSKACLYPCPLEMHLLILAKALAPYVSTLRGIDISEGMVEQYNAAAQRQGLSEKQMRGVRGDLLADSTELNEPDLFGFDVAVMSAALHHVENPEKMVQKLAERLAPGGTLVILDGVAPSESGCGVPPAHQASHTVTRQGFKKQEMLDMFRDAGLVDAEYRWFPARTPMPEQNGGAQQMFCARAKKPA